MDDFRARVKERLRQSQIANSGPRLPAPTGPQSLQQKAEGVMGVDPTLRDRGVLLPLGTNAKGETVMAWPEFMIGLTKSGMLPGHVAEGGSFSPEDAVEFTLNHSLPRTMSRAPGYKPTTKQDLVDNAPSTDALRAAGKDAYEKAYKTGVRLKQEKYMDFVIDMNDIATKNKANPTMHGLLTGVIKELEKKVGEEPDVGDLDMYRRQLASVAKTVAPELADERRIAELVIERLDETVNTLKQSDVLSGDAGAVGPLLQNARKIWTQKSKSGIIDDIIEKAETQASGKENGIRIGFRQLLRNKGKLRGFSQEEIAFMKTIVNGSFFTKAKRFAGTMSPWRGGGQNFLGSTIGMGSGAAIGHAVAGAPGAVIGSMAMPALGAISRAGAEKATLKRAEMARALASGIMDTPTAKPTEMLATGAVRAGAPLSSGALQSEDSIPPDFRASTHLEKKVRDWYMYYSGNVT